MRGRLMMVSVVGLVGCAAGPGPGGPVPVNAESARFGALVDRYLEGGFRRRRGGGPHAGLRAEADRAALDEARRVLDALAGIDTTALGVQDRIDWLQIAAAERRTLADTVLRLSERMPGRYIALGTVPWQIAGDRSPTASDWSAVLRTLLDVPSALAIGRERLRDPPALWLELAQSTAFGYGRFLSEEFHGRIAQAPDSLRSRLGDAAVAARTALGAYATFLADTVGRGADDSWATGGAYYDWLLREAHFLPYTAESMIAEGYRIHEATKRALDSLARATAPGRTWRDLVADMQSRHPEPGHILAAYRTASHRTLGFLITHDLITIPPCEELRFVPTAPQNRETYAWGGYGGIDERDGVMYGRFFVTDVAAGMTPEQVDDKLKAQNHGWIHVIALHEGYPGHHLQQVYARRHPRPVRRRMGSTYFGEGWALYAEHWLVRDGLLTSADERLAQLQMRLWRTARVIVDPSLHTGRMSYDDAVRFFVEEVGLTRSAAEAEVNRYTTWPTQAPSYIIGWLAIERLETELRGELGARFDAKRFREVLLEQGSLPLDLMRRAVREAMRGPVTLPRPDP